LDYTASRQHLALLKNEAHRFAQKFEGLAKLLDDEPERIAPDLAKAGLPSYERISTQAKDIDGAPRGTSRLCETLVSRGLPTE
jgi:hypothetical protein